MLRSSLILVSAAVGLAASTARAEEPCLSDWSVAAPIVKAQGLVTVEDLAAKVRTHEASEIVSAALCPAEPGRYEFRLVLRAKNGQRKTLRLDAKKPYGD